MSMHKQRDAAIDAALQAHHLPWDKPSQLADSFRCGWRAALTQGAGAVEPDSREVVSDDELEQAFRNTNFGGSDHRTLLHVGVLKKACGYHCGHTITTIMTELGLIGIGGVPTKKGRRMMQIAYHAQMLKGP